jgi:AraC-like DNA-binding protein
MDERSQVEQDTTIERRKPVVDFRLQKMERIYERAGGRADVLHRHDYYTVLFVEEAKGHHLIDYQKFAFEAGQVYFVSPGQVHQVALSELPKGWVITFSRAFLAVNNIPESFISNINLFRSFGDSPPLKIDGDSSVRLQRIIGEMESCLPLHLNYRTRALGALLQLFLIYCNNSTEMDDSQIDEEHSGICLLRDFKKLVEDKYRQWHKVADYASEIHVTPKHLSQTVKNITGKVAKDHIQDRLLLEAKRLLLHTDLNIKEVGYTIGFEEPLHFSSFFKKHAGTSPTAFRAENAAAL